MLFIIDAVDNNVVPITSADGKNDLYMNASFIKVCAYPQSVCILTLMKLAHI
jgi:hypothetical protein